MPSLTVSEIAALCGGELRGDPSRVVTGANTIEDAGPNDLSFVANEKAMTAARQSRAACLIVPRNFSAEGRWSLIAVDQPRSSFARVLERLYTPRARKVEHHPTAIIDPSAEIGGGVAIGPYAVIETGAVIGDGSTIGQHVIVGENVRLGPECYLYGRVVLYPNVQLGARCVVHSGAVIGADGFGFALDQGKYVKFPQVGTVVIGNNVEIGANSCIDRAALGATVVGNGTKLDNLVHIGHNCKIGSHVVMAAQVGLSGGVEVGDYAVLAGQVGIADRAKIAPHAVLGAQAGILPDKHVAAGEPVWGTPARPLRQYLKNLAQVGKLPEKMDRLEEKMESLDRKLSTEKV